MSQPCDGGSKKDHSRSQSETSLHDSWRQRPGIGGRMNYVTLYVID